MHTSCQHIVNTVFNTGMAHLLCGRMCGWQVKLCDPSLTCSIPACHRDELYVILIKCHTSHLLYFISQSSRQQYTNKAMQDRRLFPNKQFTQGCGQTRIPSNEYKAFRQPVTTVNAKHAPLCENVTSSTKLEVHNIFNCPESRTKPWPQ